MTDGRERWRSTFGAVNLSDSQFLARSEPTAPIADSVDLGSMSEATGPDFEKHDLIPVIAQDHATGDVLMLAYMNRAAWNETLASGRVCYFSRSRNKLWRKGEESGNVQVLKEIYYDCDADTLLVKVEQIGGAACHEGYRSCFFRRIDRVTGHVETVGDRVFDPKTVYRKP